ncbi:MAG: VWA domain-containing protein, partial [Lentisphaeria bacterium]|nr:VWA domain-containing protein [Lentisphaeria bacterium]
IGGWAAMTLAFSEPLWLLLVLPAAGLVLWRRHQPLAAFSVPSLSLLPPMPARLAGWHVVVALLYGLSVLLLIGALAGPQLSLLRAVADDAPLDLVLLLDLSGSMAAGDWPADDPPPQPDDVRPETAPPSRIAVAQEAISALLAALPTARVGLVAFAGRPYVVCPLMRSHGVLLERLAQLSPALLADGTAIGEAIRCGLDALAVDEFVDAAPEAGRARVLLLFSDGADHSPAEGSPEHASAAAAAQGVVLHSVGIGGARGLHPVVTAQGRRWEAVGEELDAEQLRRIATATGGQFYLAADAAQLKAVQRELVALMDRPALERRERQVVPIASECLVAALLALTGALVAAVALRIDLA